MNFLFFNFVTIQSRTEIYHVIKIDVLSAKRHYNIEKAAQWFSDVLKIGVLKYVQNV